MRSPIPEALLEMHYFHLLRDHFAQVLGQDDFHIFKPSTRRENWYGFDQAYFTGEGTTTAISESIRVYLHENYGNQSFELQAYFLQFKVVEKILRRSTVTPTNWTAPYYRSTLSLDPKKETGMSQHETLMRASSIQAATACYVCPMIFSEDSLMETPQFSELRMVDITTAPQGWATNKSHHICFQDVSEPPYWCSEPTPAKLLEFDTLVRSAAKFSPDKFDDYLVELQRALTTKRESKTTENTLPMSMMVIATPIEG